MPNKKWSELNHMQLGRYGEYYAKMEFSSYNYEVYTSEVDNHGVDFVAKNSNTGEFFEVQVKSVRKGSYTYIQKDKITLDKYHLVCFLYFTDGELPKVYIIPATAWKTPNAVLVDRKYNIPGQKSKPEWGIQYSKKNAHLLEKYSIENFFDT